MTNLNQKMAPPVLKHREKNPDQQKVFIIFSKYPGSVCILGKKRFTVANQSFKKHYG